MVTTETGGVRVLKLSLSFPTKNGVSLAIKYIGRLQGKCESCGRQGTFMYKDDKMIMISLFPEVDWEEETICEPCAKKASGSKYWNKIKRK